MKRRRLCQTAAHSGSGWEPRWRFIGNDVEIEKADGEFHFTVPIGWSFPLPGKASGGRKRGRVATDSGLRSLLQELQRDDHSTHAPQPASPALLTVRR